jgi:hypothetical protein
LRCGQSARTRKRRIDQLLESGREFGHGCVKWACLKEQKERRCWTSKRKRDLIAITSREYSSFAGHPPTAHSSV